jgi:hypothetical protein
MTSREVLAACRALVAFSVVALGAVGCQGRVASTGGETHFLTACDDTPAACGTELACRGGVCTLPCEEDAACSAFPNAECVASTGSVPTGTELPGTCDVRCAGDAECERVSPDHQCVTGVCRVPDGDAGANSCTPATTDPNQVLVIGDSFFAATHQITAYLEDAARMAGALEAGERYRDQSSLLDNALADGGIANQYAAGLAEGAVELVVMNGGGADVLFTDCETGANCSDLTDAANEARALFARMAGDGVRAVVFVGYPDPVEAALAELMDAFRPMIQAECAASPVPCHWVDLRTPFAGRYDAFIDSDGLNPTAEGSRATATAIWTVLERNCLAQ